MKRISDLERKYVLDVLDNEFNTSKNSIYNNKLEAAFASKFKMNYAIGQINGTATLHTALHAIGVKPGDEVIVPPLTMSSTALAVLQNGSIPVFADVDIDTFNISAESIAEKITNKTKAIITVALYGLSPEYDAILDLCKKHNIGLVEDNAECFLSKYKGKYVGEFGDFSSFSFQASKHLTAGEGGMLLCNSEEYANNARRFSSLGYAGVSAKQGKITREDIQDPQYSRHVAVGFNYRMSELCAAVVLGQLERAEELVETRIQVAKLFDKAIEGSNVVRLQKTPDYCLNTYWSYSLVLNTDKPEVDWYKFRNLFKQNGGDGYYAAWKLSYFEPLFLEKVQNMPGVTQKYVKGLCVNSEYLQPRMIQLKTNYWDLKEAEIQAEILQKTLNQY
ncbi:MAG: spore coat protein [Chitinophagaceae bacterium BSSC1]|jgi:perosamine synthetase|nr:MAG: spore coat protein [Chitinophagaceae bacterium BSSC1]